MRVRTVRPDMHVLMLVAVAGAMALGDWCEAATVAFLFALALLLESWSVERARLAIRALMDLAPPRLAAYTRKMGVWWSNGSILCPLTRSSWSGREKRSR